MLCGCGLFDTLSVIIALVAVFYTYYKWTYQYWSRKNLPYLQPSIPFGNLGNPFKRTESLGVSMKKVYNEMKTNGWKHGGLYFFTTPIYFVLDLDYLKNILTKDFQHFVDRGMFYDEKNEPLTAHLFAIGGQKWRNLRTKLTPTFTSGKMKMMFQTLVECLDNLEEVMDRKYEEKSAIDIKEILGCFTTDIIGSCAFGLECNTFKEGDSPFRKYGKKVFSATKFQQFKNSIAINYPSLARFLRMKFMSQDISDFFMEVVKDTVEYREKNNYSRKDFMQLLIEMKNNKVAEDSGYQHDGNSLTIKEIAAQAFIFFLAGFETSSTTMTFALYELASHQDIQNKVRDEINSVLGKHDGKITYDSIQDLKYMNQVLDETLRKYPPVPLVTRTCVQDYKIPGEDIIINKGTRVMIPIMGLHYDEEYFPEPEKFDPERFSEENKQSRHQYSHIPFGEGPRICIGMRFGLMQSKVGLAYLLKNYRFTVNKKTQEPLKMAVKSFVLAAEGEVWLNADRIV